jgi:hypothetical protein
MSSNEAFNNSAPVPGTNQHGQGASHATDHSKVPQSVQNKAPKGLEEKLPDSVRHPVLCITAFYPDVEQ